MAFSRELPTPSPFHIIIELTKLLAREQASGTCWPAPPVAGQRPSCLVRTARRIAKLPELLNLALKLLKPVGQAIVSL